MRIANIHYTGFGGLAAVVNGMVSAPGAEAHEWIMGYYGVAPLDPSHQAFCAAHGFRHATFRPRPRRPWAAWRELVRWLDAERPDAILCHSITAIPPCAWYAKRWRVPLIAIEHTPNEVKSRTEWAGSRAAMLIADRVVVLTDVYASLLKVGLGKWFRDHKLRLVPNGVNASVFYPPDVARPKGILRAGMAARLAHSKRQDLLLDVASEVGMTLDFAGDGECMSDLQTRAAKHDGSMVEFSGLVPSDDMPTWLRGLDIYVHASEGETFSMSVLQAMATGLPIIASDISGMDQLIGRDGRCGILVPNTLEAWEEALTTLIRDPERRVRMGKAARERAEQEFSTSAMLQRYLDVIKEVKGS